MRNENSFYPFPHHTTTWFMLMLWIFMKNNT